MSDTKNIITLKDDLEVNQAKDLANADQARNHVAMTFTALYTLKETQLSGEVDAASDAIRAYREDFLPKIVRPLPAEYSQLVEFRVTRETWKQSFGEIRHCTALMNFFVEELNSAEFGGEGKKLAQVYLPQLERGVNCFAFHSLLRLAFGLDAKNDAEIAFALGHVAAGYFEAPLAKVEGKDTTAEILSNEALNQLVCPTEGNIDTRIKAVFATPDFQSLSPDVGAPSAATFTSMRQQVVAIFEGSHHFAIMHALSSLAAIQTLNDEIPGVVTRVMLNAYWSSVLAVVLQIRNISKVKGPPESTLKLVFPEGEEELSPDSATWPAITKRLFAVVAHPSNVAQLRSSQFEHSVKCLFSSILEAKRCPELEVNLKRIALREIATPSPYW